MLRVRQIIDNFDYCQLVRDGVIPNIFKEKVKQGNHPSAFSSSKLYSASGIYMEILTFKMLKDLGYITSTRINDIVNDLSGYESAELLEAIAIINSENYEKCLNALKIYVNDLCNVNATKDVKLTLTMKEFYKHLSQIFRKQDNIKYEQKYSYESVIGHPDLVTKDAVYDIKTSSRFEKMRKETCLQILSYVAIMRVNGYVINKCGVMLPLQAKTLIENISKWDSSRFLTILVGIADDKIGRRFEFDIPRYLLTAGCHIPKNGTILSSLKQFYSNHAYTIPCQIFLASPQRQQPIDISDSEIRETKEYVISNDISFYIHAPYYLNLCKPRNERSIEEKGSWVIKRIKKELDLGVKMAARGVVVHTGKSLKIENAEHIMRNSIRLALRSATRECPLLIETPAGEGSELCYQIEDFIYLFSRLKTRENFGICVDTCHVFVAGYDPYDYIMKLTASIPVEKLRLIHFNGSKKAKGSRVDRHYPVFMGGGEIPMSSLMRVMYWANEKNVPLVTE